MYAACEITLSVDLSINTSQTAIKDVLQEQLLLVNEAQVSKTMQLYNTMLVRHGVMQVGGTSGGKTTSRNVLAYALAKIANSQPLFNQNAPPSVRLGLAVFRIYTMSIQSHPTQVYSFLFSIMAEAPTFIHNHTPFTTQSCPGIWTHERDMFPHIQLSLYEQG